MSNDYILSGERYLLPGLVDLHSELVNQNFTIKATFKFPKIKDTYGEEKSFGKYDVDTAAQLIFDWHRNLSKVTPITWRAFPEVKDKSGKPTALHYHALLSPKREAKFLRVAPRKWLNLLKHRFPQSRSDEKMLWLDRIDRLDPEASEAYEAYVIKHQDDLWNAQNALSSTDLHTPEQKYGLYRFQKAA